MTAHKTERSDVVNDQGESANEVRLVGRLAADPQLRELPSGDSVWNLRVVVERPLPSGKEKPRQRVDSLEPLLAFGDPARTPRPPGVHSLGPRSVIPRARRARRPRGVPQRSVVGGGEVR